MLTKWRELYQQRACSTRVRFSALSMPRPLFHMCFVASGKSACTEQAVARNFLLHALQYRLCTCQAIEYHDTYVQHYNICSNASISSHFFNSKNRRGELIDLNFVKIYKKKVHNDSYVLKINILGVNLNITFMTSKSLYAQLQLLLSNEYYVSEARKSANNTKIILCALEKLRPTTNSKFY